MPRNISKLVLLSFILTLPIYGEDSDPYFANRGHLLPKDSWVFSSEKAKDVRDRLIDLDVARKSIESYKTSLDLEKGMQEIQDKKIKLLVDQNDNLAKNLTAERSLSSWEKALYFFGGIAATVLAGWAIKKAGE